MNRDRIYMYLVLVLLVLPFPVAGYQYLMHRRSAFVGPTDFTKDANCVAAYLMNVVGTYSEFDRAGTNDLAVSASDSIARTTSVPSGFSGYSRHFVEADTEYLWIADGSTLDISGSDQDLSLVYWYNPDDFATADYIVGKFAVTGDQRQYASYINFSLNNFIVSTNGTGAANFTATATSTLVTGVWNHVACIYDASSDNQYIYINGVAEDTNSFSGGIFDGTGEFRIGARDYSANPLYADGHIDEVAVFDRVLTLDEIKEIYTNGIDGTKGANDIPTDYTQDANCVAAYFMNGATASNEVDRSTSGYDLTLGSSGVFLSSEVPSGYEGNSRSFVSGQSDYMLNSSLDIAGANQNMSGACWIRFDSTNTVQCFFGQYDLTGNQRSWRFVYNNASEEKPVRIILSSDGSDQTNATVNVAFAPSVWNHMAYTYDDTQMILYTNAVAATTNLWSGGFYDSTAGFKVGANNNVNNYLDARMDELIVFDRALSAEEVLEIYTYGIDGSNGAND